ncbi:serine/threonine-protein kinase par-1-like [Trichomycterus rosablanca]|uniref:serine/threonine-protein kinase par-1-like n=1 Tax=Trichomycterus rosablanca TaxID=2290929 RepID=UPI002F357B76
MAPEQKRCATHRPARMQRFLGIPCRRWPHNRAHPQPFQDVCAGETESKGGVEAKKQIIMEGYLFKRGSNVFKTWNRRWFLIQNNQLMYQKKSENPTVVMEDLRLCTAEHYKSIGRRFCFKVVSPTKKCVLQADSEERREEPDRKLSSSSSSGETLKSISITSQLNKVVDLKAKQEGFSSSESRGSKHAERDSLRLKSVFGSSVAGDKSKTSVQRSSSPSKVLTRFTAFIERIFSTVGEVVLEPAAEYDSFSDASLLHSVEIAGARVRRTPHIRESLEQELSTFSSYFIHTEDFDRRYRVGKLLGKGGCGSVFAGLRKIDGQEPGEKNSLPKEVALMLMASEPPRCEHVLELLEWFDTPECYFLILERPVLCMNLFEYRRDDALPERLAQIIMRQVVLAARHCQDCGVLHRDIKEGNLLVCLDRLEVKLIDFGCGDLLKSSPYRGFSGTLLYAPPEWFKRGKYHGCPATVWSLGILLFVLVCGEMPFWNEREITAGHLKFKLGVSKACRHLIRSCLSKNPKKRPSLEKILEHHWFPESLKN